MRVFSTFTGIGGLYEQGYTQKMLAEHFGVSQAHISRTMKRFGLKARVPKNLNQTGENNASWKGNDAGYAAHHYRVEKIRGKPSTCSMCDTTSAKRFEWASVGHKYHDPFDYIRLCKSCHAKFDGIINNITKELA